MDVAALAALAGNTLVTAAVTDAWEDVRHKIAKIFGRGRPDPRIEERFDATRAALEAAASSGDAEKARAGQEASWTARLTVLLEDYPEASDELDELVREIRAVALIASDHAVTVGGNVNITAGSGGVGAGVIHGKVSAGPYQAGPGVQLTGSGIAGQFERGAVAAYGGPAIGTYVAAPRPEPARLPVSLPPRPPLLVGREDLLAELHRLLTEGERPRTVVLRGPGGAGKTSLAAEYAHRHLGEVAVAWQVAAEDPAVLAAELAELAAQVGARQVADPRDPVASLHAVLAAYPAEWLLVFDNAPDEASIRRFLPRAGPGQVLVTSQSPHWQARRVLDVPPLGDADLRYGLAIRYLARSTGEAGDPARARDLLSPLLPVIERVLGPAHPDTLAVRDDLARWTGEAGGSAAARDLYAALLTDTERVLGPEDPFTMGVRGSHARWTGEAGDPAAARDLYAALLTDTERVLGPEHPDTLAVRANLPRWTGEAGDPAAARDLYAALLPVIERVFRPEHSATLAVRVDLARQTGEAGDPAAARDLLAALLPDHERVLGPEHPATLEVRANLAYWTDEAGDPAAARHMLADLLIDTERLLGSEHPDTLAVRANLAYSTGEAGDPAAARDMLAGLLTDNERVLGPAHPYTLAVRSDLARWTAKARA